LCVFVLLQVTVGVTTGREGESRADPPISGTDSSGAWVHAPLVTVAHGTRAASVPARISAVPEALPLQFLEF